MRKLVLFGCGTGEAVGKLATSRSHSSVHALRICSGVESGSARRPIGDPKDDSHRGRTCTTCWRACRRWRPGNSVTCRRTAGRRRARFRRRPRRRPRLRPAPLLLSRLANHNPSSAVLKPSSALAATCPGDHAVHRQDTEWVRPFADRGSLGGNPGQTGKIAVTVLLPF
jgi:hypothetical protein